MLYFVSAELALGYWLFAFLCALGALQWVAARYGLGGLSFFDSSHWRAADATGSQAQSQRWGVPGVVFAALLVVGSAIGFFVTQWAAIFAPGPAGSELAVLFATSAACALAVTIGVPILLERRRQGHTLLDVGEGGQRVAVGHATGYVYAPIGTPSGAIGGAGPTTLAPAVCLLPAYPTKAGRSSPSQTHDERESTSGAEGVQSMVSLARRLAQEGVVTLLIQPDEQTYAYPASLAILPAAVAVLSKRPDVDTGRIGVLGDDLGGDLAIRAASTSKEIKAVAALAPILADVPAGLDLLHEMSYFRALRWARDRKRASLRQDLNAAEYAARIPPRPLLLLYGEQDRLVGDPWTLLHLPERPHNDPPRADGIQVQVIPGAGHFHLAEHPMAWQAIRQWLKEHL